MKKMKSSYRLQIIKEVAQRHQLLESGDLWQLTSLTFLIKPNQRKLLPCLMVTTIMNMLVVGSVICGI